MKVDMNRVLEACMEDENMGFCIACGAEQGGVEPDGRGYKCDVCGCLTVYGAEELCVMTGGL